MSDLIHAPRRSLTKWLTTAVPGFVPDPARLGDDLEYVIVCDFAQYICDRANAGDWEAVRKGIDFMEMFLAQGDSNSIDLVIEGLESLAPCVDIEGIKHYFGPKVLALWNTIIGS